MKIFAGTVASSVYPTVGDDNAADSVYTSFENGDNGGYGFDSWVIAAQNNGGVFRGAVGAGFGNINTSGVSWGAYGGNNTGGTDGVNANRNLNRDLSVGFALSAVMAVQYRSGDKGFSAFQGSGFSDEKFNVNVGGDQYSINNNNQGDVGYSSDMIISIVLKQTSTTGFDYSVNFKGTQVTNQDITKTGTGSGVIRGFKYYVFETGGESQSDLFYNSVKVYRY